MIETVEQLKQERPDLVQIFEKMSRKELLNQIYLEVKDGLNMEERVQVFMNEVTSLSYTTYTPEVIKGLVSDAFQKNISQFCETALEDIEEMNIQEIKEYFRNETV